MISILTVKHGIRNVISFTMEYFADMIKKTNCIAFMPMITVGSTLSCGSLKSHLMTVLDL